jgi:hypothetical protein
MNDSTKPVYEPDGTREYRGRLGATTVPIRPVAAQVVKW